MQLSLGATLILLSLPASGFAHPVIPQNAATAVIPAAEHQAPPGLAPRQTRDVSTKDLGAIALSQEFRSLNDRVFRARLITIEPGGSVAWHEHRQRPGVAYLLSGSLVEIRDEGQGPRRILRRQGDAVFEQTGVRHGWTNTSALPATALVVDVIPMP